MACFIRLNYGRKEENHYAQIVHQFAGGLIRFIDWSVTNQ